MAFNSSMDNKYQHDLRQQLRLWKATCLGEVVWTKTINIISGCSNDLGRDTSIASGGNMGNEQ